MKRTFRQQGMTLIELVVVMVIVGILAAVAIPSYRSYVIRSQRSDAKDALLALATQQEKHYLQCNNYAGGAGSIAAVANCAAGQLQGAATSRTAPEYALNDSERGERGPAPSPSGRGAAGVEDGAQDAECQGCKMTEARSARGVGLGQERRRRRVGALRRSFRWESAASGCGPASRPMIRAAAKMGIELQRSPKTTNACRRLTGGRRSASGHEVSHFLGRELLEPLAPAGCDAGAGLYRLRRNLITTAMQR